MKERDLSVSYQSFTSKIQTRNVGKAESKDVEKEERQRGKGVRELAAG